MPGEKETGFSEIDFHQTARERAELRRVKIKRSSGPETADIIFEELADLDNKAKEFSRLRKEDPDKAKEILKTQKWEYERSEWLDEKAVAAEMGDGYTILAEAQDKISEVNNFEIRRLRESIFDPDARRINERMLSKLSPKRENLRQDIENLRSAYPLESRAFDLVRYKKGLHQEGHIAPVPSVQGRRRQIGNRMISGKPMFLHGPTGTGKTSEARSAAKEFTGEDPEMVYCNPQTKESSIFGKTGLREQSGASVTADVYGPLSRAANEGKVVIFDEFNSLPREQMDMVKGVMNAKPGDTLTIPGLGTITIKPGFQIIFTANLKSEKHPEKQELPHQITREFEQNNLEVNYTPPDESYDIILARLMNPDGSIDLSYHDLNTTLSNFIKAMAEIQFAYTDKESEETARLTQTMDASGKRPGLKKLVLTQGTVENIIDAWKIEKQTNPNHPSFTEFLDQRLRTTLTFKEYPQSDRILAAKILASKGLLRTLTPQDIDLPQDIFNFDTANRLRQDPKAIQDLKNQSKQEVHLSLTEVVTLDPFNKKQKKTADQAKEFLPEEEKEEPERVTQPDQRQEIQSNKDFIKETFKIWGVKDDKISESEPNMKAEIISPSNLDWEQRKQDIDASKFGEYTLNPDTQNINFGQARIRIENLPDSMNGRSLAEIAQYISNTYSNRYHIPGIEYWKYIIENPNKAPQELKEKGPNNSTLYHFFFGSVLRYSLGHWDVPCVYWNGSRFRRSAIWLGYV